MVVFCAMIPPVKGDRPPPCLPDGIKSDLVVTSERVRSGPGEIVRTITVGQVLTKLNARCRRGKLVDGNGQEIYFYRLIGCWGNPPADYQELLAEQNRELGRLKKKYTVIEIPCGTGDLRRIS